MAAPAKLPTVVLGGTGYVAGELLRLIAGHPHFELAGVLSDSQPGEPVAKAFPHLASVYADTRFKSQAEIESLVAERRDCAVFSAAPHGVAAGLIDAKTARPSATYPRDLFMDHSYNLYINKHLKLAPEWDPPALWTSQRPENP